MKHPSENDAVLKDDLHCPSKILLRFFVGLRNKMVQWVEYQRKIL